MAYLFSAAVSLSFIHFLSEGAERLMISQNRHFTWRKLWLNLAIAEKELGLPIPDEAIEQMKNNLVRLSPSPIFGVSRPLTPLRSVRCLCSIWTKSSLISLPRKKRKGDMMSWRTSIHSASSRPLPQGSSSSCPQLTHPALFLIHLRHTQSWSDFMLRH